MMLQKILIIALVIIVCAQLPAEELDDNTLMGIEKINEIIFLVSNFYVENRDAQQIFLGAAEGMIRQLGSGARLFKDIEAYEKYMRDETNSVKYGISFIVRGGWHQVVNFHEFGLLSRLDLEPGDVLYNIGDIFLDNYTTDELFLILYRAILKDGPDKLTIRRTGINIPVEIDLGIEPDYSAYKLKRQQIEEIERAVLSGSGIMDILERLQLKEDRLVEHLILNKLSVIRLTAINSLSYPLFRDYLYKANNMSRTLAIDMRNCSAYSFEEIRPFLDLFIDRAYLGYYELKNGKKTKLYSDDSKNSFINRLPVTLFVSRQTYWFAEYFAQLLHDHLNAFVIGEKSFGRGDYKELYSLLDSRYYLLISTGILYTAKSRTTFKNGVVIDKDLSPGGITYTDEEYKAFLNTAQERLSSLLR